MKKPLIGITPMYDERKGRYILPAEYAQAIEKSGGVPLILPICRSAEDAVAVLLSVSAVFFTGGEDISPSLYGEEKSEGCGEVNSTRDLSEALIFSEAYRAGMPILGVCRGIQLINALLGGTLFQDIPQNDVKHMLEPPYDRRAHDVRVVPGSPLSALCGTDALSVNSYHHQAVKALAPGLESMALSPDGLVEAAFCPERRFLWLLQWHPETLFDKDEASRRIFRRFADEALKFDEVRHT